VNHRPLEFFEQLLHAGNQASALIMTRALLLAGKLDPQQLELAIQQVAAQIPLLQATIQRQGWRYMLARSPGRPAPALARRTRQSDETWQHAAIETVHRPFEEREPLWRAELIHEPEQEMAELVITFHHAICDGASATRLMQWILQTYHAIGEGRCLDGIVCPQPTDLQPPFATTRWDQFVATLRFGMANLHQVIRKPVSSILPSDTSTTVSIASRRTVPVFLRFDQPFTSHLVARTRREGTRMFGTLCAAMLLAAQEQFDTEPPPLSCFSNIDLRQFNDARGSPSMRDSTRGDSGLEPTEKCPSTPVAANDFCFGCGAFFVVTRHTELLQQRDRNPNRFWDVARSANGKLRNQLMSATAQPPHRILGPLASSWLRKTLRSSAGGRTQTIGVSNLGVAHLPSRPDGLQVRGMYSLTGQHGLGPSVMAIAATVNGELHATLSFTSPLTGESRRSRFTQDFIKYLRSATQENT
jgi:hypothetical protein